MIRVRHHRLLSALAFGLIALVVEVAGRSLTFRLDLGRHVATPAYAPHGDWYAFVLIGIKAGAALLLARLCWRFAKARSTVTAAERLTAAFGARSARSAPRVRIELSPRLWLYSFAASTLVFLVQCDAERGLTSPFGPWLHSSALPVFAVLSVIAAIAWSGVARWLADYESYARETEAYARSLVAPTPVLAVARRLCADAVPPRRLYGIAFESRPPPLPA